MNDRLEIDGGSTSILCVSGALESLVAGYTGSLNGSNVCLNNLDKKLASLDCASESSENISVLTSVCGIVGSLVVEITKTPKSG